MAYIRFIMGTRSLECLNVTLPHLALGAMEASGRTGETPDEEQVYWALQRHNGQDCAEMRGMRSERTQLVVCSTCSMLRSKVVVYRMVRT